MGVKILQICPFGAPKAPKWAILHPNTHILGPKGGISPANRGTTGAIIGLTRAP